MVDYIIVGAGSAGCVLANRLSADPALQILVLEAGPSDQVLEVKIPAAFSKLFKTPRDWALETEPDPRCDQRRHFWPQGRMLGGSSSLNAMIYMRGNRRDYDRWAAMGNRGWAYADLLPFFKRAENQHRGPDAFHGSGGPLDVDDLVEANPLSQAFVAAMLELGYPENRDFNAHEQDGAGLFQVTQRRGRRASAATAYLKPALKRPNLRVRTGARVNRVVITGGRATGVVVDRGAREEIISARRAVIVSAGALHSPALLLRSGIGPVADLRALKIDPIIDAPDVGRNLQDHIIAGVSFSCTKPISLDRAETVGNLLRFIFRGEGPLTSNIAEAGAFIRTRPELEQPDIQYHFAPAFFINHGLANPKGRFGFSIGATLIRPRSRGTLTLRSAHAGAPPRIEAGYFADPGDLETLREGVRVARRAGMTRAFDAYRGPEYLPGEGVVNDAAMDAHIRATCQTLYHQAGTCRMGSDAGAVVDPALRVNGVAGLRVVDASIMPVLVAGNTNAPVIAIAEKAAELIAGEH
ncbi:MAG: GMC family oxidoreductase N-terminal domain-containing protein [Thermoflexales bacterium]